MDIAKTASMIKKIAVDNSPLILTVSAVTGVLSTTILAVRGAFAASKTLSENPHVEAVVFEGDGSEAVAIRDLTTPEKALLTWKHYVPAAVTGTATAVCIIGANTISTRRNAALVSVYTIAQEASQAYRAKVVETLGETKEKGVRDAVAKDRLEKNPVGKNEVIITGRGESLCYDTMSGRYFNGDIETIRRAQNDINAQVINDGYASQNEFYSKIGLGRAEFGEETGWNTDNLMDISFSSHLTEGDSRPCLSLDYNVTPVRDFYKFH